MIRVIIADDHNIVREGLVQILEKGRNIKVIGQAKDGLEAAKLCNKLRPEVIIMDIGMPVLNGIEATRQILAKNKYTRVIILSMYTDDDIVLRALDAGVAGFVQKSGVGRELIEAVHAVASRKSYLTPEISLKVLEHLHREKTEKDKTDTLTKRERHILQLIAEGRTTKEIATLLNISFHTAKAHRNNIMKKLDLHSVAGLTRYAIENKLILKKGGGHST